MKSLFVGLLLFGSYSIALAQSVPLPRSKPQPVRADDQSSAQVLPLHDAQLWPSDCAVRLMSIARFTQQPTLNGPNQCGAGDLVRLDGIMMPNSGPDDRKSAAHASMHNGRSSGAMGTKRYRLNNR